MDELQQPDIKTVLLLAELHEPLSLCVEICNRLLIHSDGEQNEATQRMLDVFNIMIPATEESMRVKEMLRSAMGEIAFAQLPAAIRMMGEKQNGR